MSEQLRTELVDPRPTPKDPLEFEGVIDASQKAESTPRYNLRPRPGRIVQAPNRIIVLLVAFLRAECIFGTLFTFANRSVTLREGI